MYQRDLTGAPVRILRDGKWQPVDITDLTPEELDRFFEDNADSVTWVKFLVKWIQENVKEMD